MNHLHVTEAQLLEMEKETRSNIDKFFWVWGGQAAGTLILLVNLIQDLDLTDDYARVCIRFASWMLLISFILSPLRNFLNTYVTTRLSSSAIVPTPEKIKLRYQAYYASIVRNFLGHSSILLYIYAIFLIALAVDTLFLV